MFFTLRVERSKLKERGCEQLRGCDWRAVAASTRDLMVPAQILLLFVIKVADTCV
jgi:hypothetical protein